MRIQEVNIGQAEIKQCKKKHKMFQRIHQSTCKDRFDLPAEAPVPPRSQTCTATERYRRWSPPWARITKRTRRSGSTMAWFSPSSSFVRNKKRHPKKTGRKFGVKWETWRTSCQVAWCGSQTLPGKHGCWSRSAVELPRTTYVSVSLVPAPAGKCGRSFKAISFQEKRKVQYSDAQNPIATVWWHFNILDWNRTVMQP